MNIPFPNRKYNIIYADPPWQYKVWSKKGQGRSAESHYPTMSRKDIETLDIQSIATDDCVLFLWVTAPCLEQGIDLIKTWGFTYKTFGFTWIKTNKKKNTPFWGMGYWTRANAEICLLATRGKPKRIDAGVHQVVFAPVGRHSAKPPAVRDRIVKLLGDVPRIELFARERVNGWDCWGDEV